jgi:hypothetical protein
MLGALGRPVLVGVLAQLIIEPEGQAIDAALRFGVLRRVCPRSLLPYQRRCQWRGAISSSADSGPHEPDS